MSMQHTKGPWKAYRNNAFCEVTTSREDQLTACAPSVAYAWGDTEIQAEANARLIARRILALLLALAATALTGCASMHSVDEHFTAAPEELRVIDAPHIKWVTAVETRKICEALGSVAGQGSISETDHGCALFNRRLKSCTIFTKPDTSHSVLGHEMRHCFEGHFHEQKQIAAAAAAPPSCKADPVKP